MCLVKSPKIRDTKEKKPQYLRNPYLDGVGPEADAMRSGRNSLRITKGSDQTANKLYIPNTRAPTLLPGINQSTPYAGIQIGGGSGGRFSFNKRLV